MRTPRKRAPVGALGCPSKAQEVTSDMPVEADSLFSSHISRIKRAKVSDVLHPFYSKSARTWAEAGPGVSQAKVRTAKQRAKSQNRCHDSGRVSGSSTVEVHRRSSQFPGVTAKGEVLPMSPLQSQVGPPSAQRAGLPLDRCCKGY